MTQHLRPAIVMILLFTALLGIAYPFAVTGVAQVVFPAQANGSVLTGAGGRVVGSALIGQNFAGATYLQPRPSAAGDGYNAAGSSGSNLGPLSEDLIKRVKESADTLRADAGGEVIPADAVTTSASGLDPHISPEYARLQAPRIAATRSIPLATVQQVIDGRTEGRLLGFIGQPRVNVLEVNLDLDARAGRGVAPAS